MEGHYAVESGRAELDLVGAEHEKVKMGPNDRTQGKIWGHHKPVGEQNAPQLAGVIMDTHPTRGFQWRSPPWYIARTFN